jgi:hypothetical protein
MIGMTLKPRDGQYISIRAKKKDGRFHTSLRTVNIFVVLEQALSWAFSNLLPHLPNRAVVFLIPDPHLSSLTSNLHSAVIIE